MTALLAIIAAGCSNDDDGNPSDNDSGNREATYVENTTPDEVTVVEPTTETTLPDTSGPR